MYDQHQIKPYCVRRRRFVHTVQFREFVSTSLQATDGYCAFGCFNITLSEIMLEFMLLNNKF